MVNILIMDSGVGGLSVFQEVQESIPNAHFHYFADHAFSPYGDLSETTLMSRICHCALELVSRIQPDVIVLACNTASTLALSALRTKTSVPIIGVVPAIKTAATESTKKTIGVLATPMTIESSYLQALIENHANNQKVIRKGSTRLVSIAEDKLAGKPVDLEELSEIIKPFIDTQCDSVVLGCTHFPLLKTELLTIQPDINWIDSGKAIAKRTLDILNTTFRLKDLNDQTGSMNFYSTGHSIKALHPCLSDLGFQDIQTIAV